MARNEVYLSRGAAELIFSGYRSILKERTSLFRCSVRSRVRTGEPTPTRQLGGNPGNGGRNEWAKAHFLLLQSTSCGSRALRAVLEHFVRFSSTSCGSRALRAVLEHFVPFSSTSCRSRALRAVLEHFVPFSTCFACKGLKYSGKDQRANAGILRYAQNDKLLGQNDEQRD